MLFRNYIRALRVCWSQGACICAYLPNLSARSSPIFEVKIIILSLIVLVGITQFE
jgi:hypothetical protein